MRRDPFDQVTLAELRSRRSLKWRAFPEDVLPLWVAEMDTRLAPPILEAVQRGLADGATGYPHGNDLAEAIAAFACARWNWTIDPSLVRVVTDVMTGVIEVLRLVGSPGDAVVVTTPVYPPFFSHVAHLDRQLVPARLAEDGRIDLAALEQAFVEARRLAPRSALLLANPHNPTGVAHTRRELAAVASMARRFKARVVVDEIHAPVVYDGAAFTPYLTVPGGDFGFSVMSASKGWNLAGLKAAVIIAGAASAVDLARVPEVVSHAASAIGILAHVTAFSAAREWLDEHRAALEVRRVQLAELLATRLPEVGYRPPEATFLAWLDCGSLGVGPDPAAVFLARGRVGLNAGHVFGPGGEGHVRLNFATSTAVLTEAVERMAAAAAG